MNGQYEEPKEGMMGLVVEEKGYVVTRSGDACIPTTYTDIPMAIKEIERLMRADYAVTITPTTVCRITS